MLRKHSHLTFVFGCLDQRRVSSLVAFFAVATLGFGFLVQLNDSLISFTDGLADFHGPFFVDSIIKSVQQIATVGLASPSNMFQ